MLINRTLQKVVNLLVIVMLVALLVVGGVDGLTLAQPLRPLDGQDIQFQE